MKSRKTKLLIGVVLLATLALIWFLRRQAVKPRSVAPPASASAARDGWAASTTHQAAEAPVRAQIDPALVEEAVQQNSEQLRAAVEEFKHLHRYGLESRPLTKEMVDVLDPNIFWPVPHPVVGPALMRKAGLAPQDEDTQKAIMAEAVWQSCAANRHRFVGDEQVTLTLATYRGEETPERVDVNLGPTRIITIDAAGNERLFGETKYLRQSKTAPGEPQYVLQWRAPESLAGFTGYLKFSTTWTPMGDGDPAECFMMIHYTGAPPGRFLGTFADKLDAGSLVIDVGVEILRKEEGTYQFDGRLFAGDGVTPLAYASAQASLAEGEHQVPLRFYGLTLREAEASGPYVLKGVTGYLMTEGSAGRGPEIRSNWDAYRTAAYDYRQFTDQEWTSPEHDARIEVYEKMIRDAEEAERGARPAPTPAP